MRRALPRDKRKAVHIQERSQGRGAGSAPPPFADKSTIKLSWCKADIRQIVKCPASISAAP